MTVKLSEIHEHLKISLQYLYFNENQEDDFEIDKKFNVENFDVKSFEDVITKFEIFTFWGFPGIPDSILEFMIENPNSGVWKYLEGKYEYTQFNQKALLSNRIKRLTEKYKYREKLFFESIVDGFLDLVKYLYNNKYNFESYLGYCTNMEVIEYLNDKILRTNNFQEVMMTAAEQNNIIVLEFYMKKMKKMNNFFTSNIQFYAAKSYSIDSIKLLANNNFKGSYSAAASLGRKDLILEFFNNNIKDDKDFLGEAILSNSLEIFELALQINNNNNNLTGFVGYLDDKSKLPFIEKYSNSNKIKYSCQFEHACLCSPIEIVEFMYNAGWELNDFEYIYSNAANNYFDSNKIFEFLISKKIHNTEPYIWDVLVDLRDINIIKLALNNFTIEIPKSVLLKSISFDNEDIFILLLDKFIDINQDIFENIINLNAIKIFQLMLNKTKRINKSFLIEKILINNNIPMYELLISFIEETYCYLAQNKAEKIGMISSFETIKYLNDNSQKFIKWNHLLVGAFIKQRSDVVNFLIKNRTDYEYHDFLWYAAIESNMYESLEIIYKCGIKWEKDIFKNLSKNVSRNISKNKLFTKFLIDKKILVDC